MCDQVPELDADEVYEECPRCEGACDGCLMCWDLGVVPHACAKDLV